MIHLILETLPITVPSFPSVLILYCGISGQFQITIQHKCRHIKKAASTWIDAFSKQQISTNNSKKKKKKIRPLNFSQLIEWKEMNSSRSSVFASQWRHAEISQSFISFQTHKSTCACVRAHTHHKPRKPGVRAQTPDLRLQIKIYN